MSRMIQTQIDSMQRLLVLIMLVLGILAVLPLGSAMAETSVLPDPRQMKFEPVTFTPPDVERLVLENGLVVFLLEDHELPLVTVSAMMRTGSWLDPAEKTGLAGLTGNLMRTGGSAKMSAQRVDEELERIAAGISFSIGEESGSATLDVLKKDLETGLRIFADLLRTPAFESERVELAKLQAIEGIRRRQDQPGSIAAREFAKLMYGPAHPYARESTVESITKITRDDLAEFHRRTIHPNGLIVGVSGDFDKEAMVALLRGLMEETAAVGAALGIELPVTIERRLEAGLGVGDHKTSMLQDLEAGKPLELECMTGAVIEIAGRVGVAVPRTEAVHACASLLDLHRRERAGEP